MLFRSLALAAALIVFFPIMGRAYVLKGNVDFTPWSGYWWPSVLGELYNGYASIRQHPSPTEKYDLHVLGVYPGSLCAYARKPENRLYDPSAPYWWGLCDAVVNAVLLEQIDFQPSFMDGVLFNIGDKKGLITVAHIEDPKLVRACKNNPLPFHQYLLQYVGEQKIGVAADIDPNEEFWSYPITAYEMDISPGDNADRVSCTVTLVDNFGLSPDFSGLRTKTKSYGYRLQKDASGAYTDGEWIGDDRPELVWIPLEQKSDIPGFDYETVRKIAEHTGDGFEGQTVLPEGRAPLLVGPVDGRNFEIRVPEMTGLKIGAARDPQTARQSVQYRLLQAGILVGNGTLDENMQWIAAEAGPEERVFELWLAPAGENTLPVAVQVFVEHLYPHTAISYAPVLTREALGPDTWTGIGFGGSDGLSGSWSVLGETGLPMFASGIKNIQGQGRWAGVPVTTGFMDPSFAGSPSILRIGANRSFEHVALTGLGDKLSGLSRERITASEERYVIPFMTDSFNRLVQNTLVLHNQRQGKGQYVMEYASPTGTRRRTVSFDLESNRVQAFRSRHPGNISGEYWGLLNNAAGLGGTLHLAWGKDQWDELPLLPLGSAWILPHVAEGGGWTTRITLCNPSDAAQTVSVMAILGDGTSRTAEWTLPSWARQERTMAELFPQLSGVQLSSGWAAVNSPGETAGFFTYQGAGMRSSMPLVRAGDTETVARLPHVAEDGYWWTGVAVLNRETVSNTVSFQAHAADGTLLGTTTRHLWPSAKGAWTVGALFPEKIDHVASLTLEGTGGMCPLVLYGGEDQSGPVLSGMLF